LQTYDIIQYILLILSKLMKATHKIQEVAQFQNSTKEYLQRFTPKNNFS